MSSGKSIPPRSLSSLHWVSGKTTELSELMWAGCLGLIVFVIYSAKRADHFAVPQANSLHRVVRFGGFEADLRSGELRKDGIRIRLQEQPFHILQALLERPGEIVTREELRLKLWPADTYVDFDHGLNNAIKRLREGLNDSAENPKFIETLSRRGYRFIGPHDISPSSAASQDSIAVLPFTNLSMDPENEFFADGITEEIINALAQIERLHVAARSSAFSFKGKHIDPRVVGEQLNVRTVLEGSVRRAGNCLRITVQLVNAADGYHLWSERYDREIKDIFDIQDEIARAIAERLKVTLEGGGQEPLLKAGTRNLEAYQLYVKGRAFVYRRGGAIPRAVECFKRAVALDSDYALAWAGLADSYTTLGYYGLACPDASMPKAVEAARRAVTLGPSLAEAHAALAIASLMGAWDKAEAEREFQRALELNPRYIQARDWYALFYLALSEGQLEEGVAQAKRALESDPLSSYAHGVYGFVCGCAGRYPEAIQAARRAVELDSESYLARYVLQEVLHLGGKFEESVAAGELALAMSGRHSWSMAFLAVTFADLGKTEDADAVCAEMLARARRQYVPPAVLAVAASAAAREEEAIRRAHDAFAIRDPHCQFFFSRHEPSSARIYAYPRFREIIARMGRSDWLRD
jgi:TolB-like protein/Tfp pilus assembly protein PilF